MGVMDTCNHVHTTSLQEQHYNVNKSAALCATGDNESTPLFTVLQEAEDLSYVTADALTPNSPHL